MFQSPSQRSTNCNSRSESHDVGGPNSMKISVLLELEEELGRSMEGLKKRLGQANKEIVGKVENIQQLSKKLQNLLEKIEPWRGKQNDVDLKEKIELELNKTDGGKEAVSIFPEEIWSIIFGNLTDWKDLLNCSQTCILFEKVLHSSKTTYLFEKVFPLIFKHLPLNDILRCRSVSKSWNEVVDGFFENHHYFQPHDDNHADPRHPPFVNPLTEKKLDVRALRLFRTNFSIANAGQLIPYPFIGRSKAVMIGFNDSAGIDDRLEVRFWNSLYRFLEAYGKHIWYFKVFLLKPEEFPIKMRKILFKFLTADVFRLVPNLRKLHICGFFRYSDNFADILPSLSSASKLETLQVDIASDDFRQVIDVISNTYHNQLRKLHVEAKQWSNVSHLEWRNLTELHVEDLRINDAPFIQIKLPKLRKLGVSLDSNDDWTLEKFLEVINNVSTLNPINTLRIGGTINKEFQFGASLQSNLYGPTTLKTLEIEHNSNIYNSSSSTCYTFLLRFPFVENINLFWRKLELREGYVQRSEIELRPTKLDFRHDRSLVKDEKVGRLEIVEVEEHIHQGGMGLYHSNIWELLPKLKVLTFQEDLYTRGGYENFLEKKMGL